MVEAIDPTIWEAFMPAIYVRGKEIKENNTRFAHYTSAESGMKILQSGKMLLRNSAFMNDFSEVQHGMDCLFPLYNGPIGERLRTVMDYVQSGLPDILQNNFNSQLLGVRSETYLTSISEHANIEGDGVLEDIYGRLSMWRAYANNNGIAFVFNNTPFLSENNPLNAYTTPVMYADRTSFEPYFEYMVNRIEAIRDQLKAMGGKFLHDNIMEAFRFIIQSTKHPAFKEEREWRIIYTPSILEQEGLLTSEQEARIPSEIMTLGGVPQRVYSIPFKDYPEEGFVGATIPDLIDRVLIGPSRDAYAIATAFAEELRKQGVTDALQRVVMTGIPLRT